MADVLRDDVRARHGWASQARALAEREFALDGCATRFEEILGRVAGVVPAARADLDMWDESPLVEIQAG